MPVQKTYTLRIYDDAELGEAKRSRREPTPTFEHGPITEDRMRQIALFLGKYGKQASATASVIGTLADLAELAKAGRGG